MFAVVALTFCCQIGAVVAIQHLNQQAAFCLCQHQIKFKSQTSTLVVWPSIPSDWNSIGHPSLGGQLKSPTLGPAAGSGRK